jgi:hypothetical protein
VEIGGITVVVPQWGAYVFSGSGGADATRRSRHVVAAGKVVAIFISKAFLTSTYRHSHV